MTRGSLGRLWPLLSSGLLSLSCVNCLVLPPPQVNMPVHPTPRHGGLESSEPKSQSQGFFCHVVSAKHFITMVIRVKRTLASDLACFLFWGVHNDSQSVLWRGLCSK